MVLYGLICMLLFRVLALLLREKVVFKKPRDYFISISFMTALIFAAHPIHTEVAANIKGRDELMALLFGLLAWKSVITWFDYRTVKSAISGGVFFFLALMSKESAAPLLILLPLSVYCCRSREVFRKSALVALLSLAAAFTVFMVIRQSVLGWGAKPAMEDNILSNSFMYASGLSERYGTTFYTLWLYVRLLLFPYPLTIDYYPFYIPYVGMFSMKAIFPLVLYAALSVTALILAYRKNLAGFGLLFYLIALFPVSNLLFIVGPFMGERFAFIPSLGFIFMLAWVIIRVAEKIRMVKYLPGVLSLLLLTFSGMTISRNFDWKDNFTLYTHDVETSVNSAVITKGAGHEFLLKAEATQDYNEKKSYAEQAVPYLEQAVKLNKTTTETLLLGNAYYESGNIEPALKMYLETLKLSATYEKAFTNYLIAVNRLPSPPLKIDYYNVLIRTTGERFEPYYQKGLVFGKEMNMPDSSISNLVRASGIDSTKVDCLSDLGVAFAMKGDFAHSAFYLEKALRANPSDNKTRQNLAASYYRLGNLAKAKELTGGR
jgi:tetratricopeptide (TPR) repeat protein